MIRPSTPPGLERFRMLVADRLGLSFDDTRRDTLAEALERRSKAHALEIASYLDQLERLQDGADELSALGAELTIGETYFFRHTEQMRAFAEVALPDRRLVSGGLRPVRILSAGCASGEEAYTLAILSCEQGLVGPAAPEIQGLDLNPRVLERAQRAQYSEWALRDTSEPVRKRYFKKEGSAYHLLRSRLPTVRFRQANLIDDETLSGSAFDIVFCRNVLMYFTREQAARTLSRIAGALAPGGYLFLGHAETLHGLSNDFELRQAHGAFFYQRKNALGSPGDALPPASSRRGDRPGYDPTPAHSQLAGAELGKNWLDVVDRSSQRIQALEARERDEAKPPSAPARRWADPLSRRTISLLFEAERWDEALDLLGRAETTEADPERMALRAAVLMHSGKFEAAEQACLATLARDEESAPAHYLLALLRERQGKHHAAMEHDRIAAELDPSFAMPELHLGLLATQTKDLQRARAAYGRAIFLLEREDPWRILVFGGGFGRAALVQLCENELVRAGGAP